MAFKFDFVVYFIKKKKKGKLFQLFIDDFFTLP